ncbi:MAG: hypothetical protein D9C04_05905 [Nitrosopumilus sp. B06]|nr:MAG: hypothetical protein D9C04_05905 [Nitrosopumilus sp. B06]
MTASWKIDYGRVHKKILKMSSDAALIKQYRIMVSSIADMDDDGDPANLGSEKTGKYAGCYGRHLTKSDSLIYRVDYERKIVQFVAIGDHKELYGRG